MAALTEGRHAFRVMQRPGRQHNTAFLGAEITDLEFPRELEFRGVRTASFSARVALLTVWEAWTDARLQEVDPYRIGLVIGGTNLQQRELLHVYSTYGSQSEFISPVYGFNFMDTDLCGVCSHRFGIRGVAYTLGAASASGQLAVLAAAELVRSGQVDVCIAVGALMDLSYLEFQGLRSLGAMGSDR